MDRKSKAQGGGAELSNPRNGEIRGRIDTSRALNISVSFGETVLTVVLLDQSMHEI